MPILISKEKENHQKGAIHYFLNTISPSSVNSQELHLTILIEKNFIYKL